MEADDELWPPFGPGAEFRQGSGRYGHPRDSARRERQAPDRRGQEDDRQRQQDDRQEQQGAAGRGRADGRGRAGGRRPASEGQRTDAEDRAAEFQRRLVELDQHRSGRGGWGPPPGSGSPAGPRGRDRHRPVLSRDDIVAAAISIADRFGAEAVSIRKIAQLVQAGAMSLYWHLANKEHLLELMLDDIQGEVNVPEPSGDWPADLRRTARSLRAVMLRHPWVIDFFGSRPPLGPKTLRSLDDTLALFDGADVDLATAINVVQTINTYVSGAVVRELQEIRTQREQDEFVADDTEFFEKLEDWKHRLAVSGKFDHFIRMFDADIDPDADETRDERFAFGLDCLLQGVALRLAKRGSQAS